MNYYTILGVLPTAEDVVIRAAYRALAQRYHPDRYSGSPNRMTEINEAYETLSSPDKRKEYDRNRAASNKPEDEYFGEGEADEEPTFDPLEKDWTLAVEYYTDLPDLERRLAKISWRLASTYRAYLLEAKGFDRRKELAETMEKQFLETYFGTNPAILIFARNLIEQRNKQAARALNNAIRVFGNNTAAETIISRIEQTFGLHTVRAEPKPIDSTPQPPHMDWANLAKFIALSIVVALIAIILFAK